MVFTVASLVMTQRITGSGRSAKPSSMPSHTATTRTPTERLFCRHFPRPERQLRTAKIARRRNRLYHSRLKAQLKERKRKIMIQAQKEGFVTSGWCGKTFDVAYQTVYRDLNGLLKLELVETIGRGRSTRYIPKIKQG
jgi:predicted HTH transcriptional regulator